MASGYDEQLLVKILDERSWIAWKRKNGKFLDNTKLDLSCQDYKKKKERETELYVVSVF